MVPDEMIFGANGGNTMPDLKEVKKQLEAARKEAERLEREAARYEAVSKWDVVTDAILANKHACGMVSGMSRSEAEVFAKCLIQNMQYLYDACAKDREDARNRDAAMVEKRKQAAKAAAEKRAAKKAAENAKVVQQGARPVSQVAQPVSSETVRPQSPYRPQGAQR